MKRLLIILTFSTILASCGKEQKAMSTSSNKSKFILGAFTDIKSPSTLDLSQLQDLPKSIDLSKDMTPVKNQSDRGTCTIFSVIGLAEAAIKKDLNLEVNLSEEFLNYIIQKSKPQSAYTSDGADLLNAIAAQNDYGSILEEDWSYQPNWFSKGLICEDYNKESKTAPLHCYSHNKPNQNALNRRFLTKQGLEFNFLQKNTNDIIKFLAWYKRPLQMTVVVNHNAWKTSGETDYNENFRSQCLKDNSLCGDHSIILTGYDMNKKHFMFKNSWGKDWGKNGYGTIPFDTVDKYVSDSLFTAKVIGEIKIPKSIGAKTTLSKFNVFAEQNSDNSISLNISASVTNTSGKILKISSYLVKKHKKNSKVYPNDNNVEYIIITDTLEKKIVKGNYINITRMQYTEEDNALDINLDDNLHLDYTKEMLTLPSVQKIRNSGDYDLAIRTSIYVHTDDNDFLELKRVFTPLY